MKFFTVTSIRSKRGPGQTDGIDEVNGQVDGTDGKSMESILLTTPSVRLRGPSRSVQFDFGFKSDRTGPLATLLRT